MIIHSVMAFMKELLRKPILILHLEIPMIVSEGFGGLVPIFCFKISEIQLSYTIPITSTGFDLDQDTRIRFFSIICTFYDKLILASRKITFVFNVTTIVKSMSRSLTNRSL